MNGYYETIFAGLSCGFVLGIFCRFVNWGFGFLRGLLYKI